MNILAVGCHPDDLEIACFGTLALYARRGDKVTICHVANGNRGHAIIEPDPLRLIRRDEAREAGALIGAASVVTLDVPDLEVNSRDPEQVKAMIDVIRQAQPDLIITHGPEDYMQDHLEVQKMVFDASFSASVPFMKTPTPGISAITPLYYMDTLAGVNFLPTEYVDISETAELKLKALDCHHSQIDWMREHDHIDFLDFVRTCSHFRGLQSGVAYAEGFTQALTWPRLPARRLLP
ncbi:MAG: PIG-L deacetylase family protein [Clostridiaceae bacterium]|nr:PIG-L deacetylase family protein [Clostridiaceae bacterium]